MNNRTFHKQAYLNIVVILLSIICIILLCTVSAPCPSGMKCKATTQVEIGIIIGLIIICLIDAILIFKKKDSRVVKINMLILKLIACLGGFMTMGFMGLCKKLDMACNVKTAPTLNTFWVITISIIMISEVFDAITLLFHCISREDKNADD